MDTVINSITIECYYNIIIYKILNCYTQGQLRGWKERCQQAENHFENSKTKTKELERKNLGMVVSCRSPFISYNKLSDSLNAQRY